MPQQIGDVKLLPVGLDPLGSDTLIGHYKQTKAHACITLVDTWALQADVMQQVQWFPLCPVDTAPLAPAVKDSLQVCQFPIAYSLHGYKELSAAGLTPAYWPHAVDPAIWHPMPMDEARRKAEIGRDFFWVSFVGVNDSIPSRKGIPELLMAWHLFSQNKPDVRLYLHTALHGNLPVSSTGGVQIDKIIRTLGINPLTVRIADQYHYRLGVPAHELAAIAAASDVFILPTRGEGFGVPLVEFQRAGCPAITTNFASGADLCFGGWLLEGEHSWSWQNAFVMTPGVASIVECLEAAYADRGNPKRRALAVEGARQYDVDTVVSRYALPVMKQIAEYVLDNWKVA